MPRNLIEFSRPFIDNSFQLYVVGGAVRDFCLGKKNSDYDFTTDATPEQVKAIFKHVIPTGIKHGTVTVLFKGESYEVTTFRTESGYIDKRHPDSIDFITDVSEDLKRRDFTINALAVKLPDKKIIDLHDGIKDLRKKTIRCIGNPHERFSEDALRMLRACRFSSQLNFTIDTPTLDAMKALKDNICFVSKERIQEELSKLLMSGNPRRGLEYLLETGLLEIILPDLAACDGVDQLGFHHEDVLQHCLSTLDFASAHNYSLEVRLTCLLHDIGKPSCKGELVDSHYTFYNHDKVGSELAARILRDLKYPNSVIDKVKTLILNHMFQYSAQFTDGAVRRFILRVGYENLDDLFRVRLSDQYAISQSSINEGIEELKNRIENLKSPNLTVNDLKLTGEDLKKMGLSPGPVFSKVKHFLLEQVLDSPQLNNKEDLALIAKKFIEQELT